MAAITNTSMQGNGSRAVSVLTLGASDTLTYNPARRPVLILDNVTGGALTPNLDGAGGTTVDVPTIGDVNVAPGYTCPSIAAGTKAAIPLNSISAYLKGAVTITGGTGIKASILEF